MDGDELRLTVPTAAPYTRLARVAVTGLATRLGFSYDEVEDLRLAVGEVCSLLVERAGEGGQLTVRYGVEDAALAVECEVDTPIEGSEDSLSSMAEQILAATVDRIDVLESGRGIGLRKLVSDDE